MSVRLARNPRSRSPERAFILAGIRRFDPLDTGANGETSTAHLYSNVHVGTLFRSFKSAFDCGNGTDCRGTSFGEMPQKTGFRRGQLVTALGRGIGATAAHEVGHQDNAFVGVRPFTVHTTTCHNCYDFTLPQPGDPYPREYFFGPLQWSEASQKAMRYALTRKP